MFSKQHYEVMASAIRTTHTRDELIETMIQIFKDDNPKFNETKFRIYTKR